MPNEYPQRGRGRGREAGVDIVGGGGGSAPPAPPPPPDDDYDYDLPVGPNGSFASSLTPGLMGRKERQDIRADWDRTQDPQDRRTHIYHCTTAPICCTCHKTLHLCTPRRQSTECGSFLTHFAKMACRSQSSVSALPELELSELEKEQIVIVIPSSLPPGSTPPPPPTPTPVMSSLLYPPLAGGVEPTHPPTQPVVQHANRKHACPPSWCSCLPKQHQNFTLSRVHWGGGKRVCGAGRGGGGGRSSPFSAPPPPPPGWLP